MKKKAVIFDMDGVLIDSEPVYQKRFSDFIAENGGKPEEEKMRDTVGASSRRTWEILAEMWKEPIEWTELRKIFHEQHTGFLIPYGEVLFPGIREMLDKLKEKGLKLAIASSSTEEEIQEMLRSNGLAGYFSVLVSGRMFRESKPNPEIYLYTLKQLELKPEECLVVEDSPYGIQAGKKAGMEVAARIEKRFSFDQSEADYFLEKTPDVVKLLEELCG